MRTNVKMSFLNGLAIEFPGALLPAALTGHPEEDEQADEGLINYWFDQASVPCAPEWPEYQ
jgi:hypothetical protein